MIRLPLCSCLVIQALDIWLSRSQIHSRWTRAGRMSMKKVNRCVSSGHWCVPSNARPFTFSRESRESIEETGLSFETCWNEKIKLCRGGWSSIHMYAYDAKAEHLNDYWSIFIIIIAAACWSKRACVLPNASWGLSSSFDAKYGPHSIVLCMIPWMDMWFMSKCWGWRRVSIINRCEATTKNKDNTHLLSQPETSYCLSSVIHRIPDI